MKLLLVDGNSILNRAFYGVKMLSNRKGVFTNAIYGFFNILLKAIEDTSATDVILAFDRKEPTFRHKADAEYKANRHGMPEELAMQMPYTKQLLEAMGYPIVTCAGWEADDILGTISSAASREGAESIILTGDKDILQLIDSHVSVRLATNKEPVLYDEDRFMAEYGFSPVGMIDYKALVGDPSDNYKGVKGIGEKTAVSLVQEYGTIEKLYEVLQTAGLSKGVREKLQNGESDARHCKWLATIAKDAPVSVNLSDYMRKPQDNEALAALLTELELNKLLQRLNLQPTAVCVPEEKEETAAVQYAEINKITAEEFEEICGSELVTDFLCRDRLMYLAWNGKCARITDMTQIFRFLTSDVPKRTFDAKPVYRMCMEQNESIHHLIQDNVICGYLLNPSSSEYSIRSLCAESGIPFPEEAGEYAEIAVMPALSDALRKKVTEEGMESLFSEIEMPLVEVLADMEHTGVRVDAEGVQKFGEKLASETEELQARIYELAGREFNILSPKQLGVILFEELALPTGKKTKTGWSTNAEVLENLRDKHPVVELILQYRQLSKLNSTYVDGLLKTIAPDGRIHTCYRQTETRTGRISSTEPNLQNIPVRTSLGKEMRKFFIAAEGHTLLDADYSQIELRLVAHLCSDENMRRTFAENLDIHRMTASQVFNLPEDMITGEMRSAAKAVNFGILYGIGAFSLSKDIGVTVAKADKYIKDYLHSFPNVEKFMNETVESAKKTGYVTTLFGRKRFIPELRASNKVVQAAGRRIAMNTPVQGTAADIIKAAMVRVWKRLRAEVPEARLILQIHDELIVEAPAASASKAAEILHTEMEHACQLSVPLTAEVQEGNSWYDAKG